MRHILLYIALLMFPLFVEWGGGQACAQSGAIDADVNVAFETAGEREYRAVQYALFRSAARAEAVRQRLEKAVAAQRGDNGMMDIEAWDKAVGEDKIKFRTSRGNGAFRIHAYPDMAVLVCSYLPDNELTIEDAQLAVITLREGQGEYEHVFRLDMSKGAHAIANVEVLGTSKDTINITAAPAIDDGRQMYFRVHVELPEGYGNERGRLVVQPMAVECQTEDTVAYVSGIVMEGREYHKVQNRRMLFDYMLHDKVAYAYTPRPMYSDEKIFIDTTLVYIKPDPRRTYKIPYTVEIADYNHIYFSRSVATGSCNRKNIFKFLDLGLAAAAMDAEEFRIDAENVYDTKNQDLRLKFNVGSAELTNDSTNQIQLDSLVNELRSYGEQLMEVRIEATSSPEGGLEANKRLAAERTRAAVARVKQYLGNTDVVFHTAQPRVCTWGEVADELSLDGRDDLASKITALAGADGYGGDAAIREIEGYEDVIEPVLQRMRMMRVTYRYEREHVMDAKEVVSAYYSRKDDLLHGRGKDFSDGDYFNLFESIRDSLELDTVTMLAYRHITKRAGYEQVKFSMYVANRMAMLNQRRGKPDTRVLAPFINPRMRSVATKEPGEQAQKNRREILINQIINYFQLEERDSALSFCNYWFANDNDPKVERLRQYIKFKEGFVKYATHQLTPQQEQEVVDAMNFVIACAPDNKAVLYTEARDILDVPNAVAMRLVDGMADDNPKKWYLRGILEADLEENRPQAATRSSGTAGAKDYIPAYLCFFHHSFLLEPAYKWLYFEDGQISDQLREKYRYRKKDFARYAEMFRSRVSLSTTSAHQDGQEMEISGE